MTGAFLIVKIEIMKKDVYGVMLTSLEEMKFSKYICNNPKLPAANTINKEQRKQLVLDWLNQQNA